MKPHKFEAKMFQGREQLSCDVCGYMESAPIHASGAAVPVESLTEPTTCKKCSELAQLLIECRDALPAISLASARLHHVDLRLADKIEEALKPWEITDGK